MNVDQKLLETFNIRDKYYREMIKNHRNLILGNIETSSLLNWDAVDDKIKLYSY